VNTPLAPAAHRLEAATPTARPRIFFRNYQPANGTRGQSAL